MKKHYKQVFSDQNSVDYWQRIYAQEGSYGDNYRQRMSIALSWLDGLGLPKKSSIIDIGCGAGIAEDETCHFSFEKECEHSQ